MSNLALFSLPTDQIEAFERFWQEFPRKIAKAEARRAWIQTEKIRPTLDSLIVALRAQRNTLWVNTQPQFIPHAATWLRGERWEDCCDSMGSTNTDAIWEAATCKNPMSQH